MELKTTMQYRIGWKGKRGETLDRQKRKVDGGERPRYDYRACQLLLLLFNYSTNVCELQNIKMSVM